MKQGITKVIILLNFIFCYRISASSGNTLFKDVNILNPQVINKDIKVKLTDYGRNLYQGVVKDSYILLLEKIIGEEFYSSLGFSYNNEEYYISITNEASDKVPTIIDSDSVMIRLVIYPIIDRNTNSPFSIITNIKTEDSKSITPEKECSNSFTTPIYGNGDANLLIDLNRSYRDIRPDSTRVDEFITKLFIDILIQKDGKSKVLKINDKLPEEMNRLEYYFFLKLESEYMKKWSPALLNNEPVDYIYTIPIRL